ncbi:MAG: diguanylate cyclase [Pseudomonadota bacterium]
MTPSRQFSLRTLAFGIAGMIAVVAVLVLAVTARSFRDAAFAAQRQALARVIAVAADEAVRHLETRLFALGTEFQERPELRAALARLQATGDAAPLRKVLDDPFIHGFFGLREVDLAKLRLYDTNLALLGQNASPFVMPDALPAALRRQAEGRVGADRLKAVSALWSAGGHVFHSVLLPVGGLRLTAYLEVVADPAFNLRTVAAMVGMPLSIIDAAGVRLYQSAGPGGADDGMLEIEYVLRDSAGATAFRLVGRADVSVLDAQMRHTILVTIGLVLAFVVLTTTLMWAFLNRILLRPVAAMQGEMKRCADGDLSVTVGHGVLTEFNVLATAFNEMTRRLAANVQELERLSHVDSLTGLPNRHQFDLCIEKEWRRALRGRTPFALLMVDVDYFKLYNDNYGHVAGDECLRAVAATIGRVVQRTTDLPARYGGEEFAILLPETPLDSAIALAERFLASLAEQNMPHAGSPLGRISASVGVAVCGADESCSPAGLIHVADAALYEAKRTGRNRAVVADPAAGAGHCEACRGFVPSVSATAAPSRPD